MSLSQVVLRVVSAGAQVANGAVRVLEAHLVEIRRMHVNSLYRAVVASSPRQSNCENYSENSRCGSGKGSNTGNTNNRSAQAAAYEYSSASGQDRSGGGKDEHYQAREVSQQALREMKVGVLARNPSVKTMEPLIPVMNAYDTSTYAHGAKTDSVSKLSAELPSGPDVPNGSVNTSNAGWLARERSVPESPLARVLNFGVLGAGLAFGAAAESFRRVARLQSATRPGDTTQSYSAFVSEANAHRLASSLSRMRGAALKLGQMISIQDERILPIPLQRALERVRHGADIMPRSQLDQVLRQQYALPDEIGNDSWMRRLGIEEFDYKPVAAASIGQVHKGSMRNVDGSLIDICFKIQYPGVARSISSDVQNLRRLISATGLLPDKFYVNEALAAAKEELERECDYVQEAANQEKFRDLIEGLPKDENVYYVPAVISSLSSSTILVSEYVNGVPIDRVQDAESKSWIASAMLRLTLAELFKFRFMQTDPNPSNFMFGADSEGRRRLYLVDFGASRSYSDKFVETYFDLICACADRDRDGIIAHSTELGFLTGEETKVMLDAHYQASIAVGEPFNDQFKGGYNFAANDIPGRTARFGRIMLEHRLTPPPKEAYSLHRRLSGAFLTAMRLGATIDCASMLEEVSRYMSRRRRSSNEPDVKVTNLTVDAIG